MDERLPQQVQFPSSPKGSGKLATVVEDASAWRQAAEADLINDLTQKRARLTNARREVHSPRAAMVQKQNAAAEGGVGELIRRWWAALQDEVEDSVCRAHTDMDEKFVKFCAEVDEKFARQNASLAADRAKQFEEGNKIVQPVLHTDDAAGSSNEGYACQSKVDGAFASLEAGQPEFSSLKIVDVKSTESLCDVSQRCDIMNGKLLELNAEVEKLRRATTMTPSLNSALTTPMTSPFPKDREPCLRGTPVQPWLSPRANGYVQSLAGDQFRLDLEVQDETARNTGAANTTEEQEMSDTLNALEITKELNQLKVLAMEMAQAIGTLQVASQPVELSERVDDLCSKVATVSEMVYVCNDSCKCFKENADNESQVQDLSRRLELFTKQFSFGLTEVRGKVLSTKVEAFAASKEAELNRACNMDEAVAGIQKDVTDIFGILDALDAGKLNTVHEHLELCTKELLLEKRERKFEDEALRSSLHNLQLRSGSAASKSVQLVRAPPGYPGRPSEHPDLASAKPTVQRQSSSPSILGHPAPAPPKPTVQRQSASPSCRDSFRVARMS